MTTTRRNYLARIESDHTYRTTLVEMLRSAASTLDGSARDIGFDELTLAKVGIKQARALRYAASQLCDHVRMSGDGTCRYCEAVIVRDDE